MALDGRVAAISVFPVTALFRILRKPEIGNMRHLGQQEPDRRSAFDALDGTVQPWFRTSIDRLRFDKLN
jgi:hypothetical protein